MNPQVHILDAIAADASKLAANGKASIRHTPATEPVLASFDRDRQALSILVENAVKYSPEGGEIVLNASQHNGTVRIEVSDAGMGIP